MSDENGKFRGYSWLFLFAVIFILVALLILSYKQNNPEDKLRDFVVAGALNLATELIGAFLVYVSIERLFSRKYKYIDPEKLREVLELLVHSKQLDANALEVFKEAGLLEKKEWNILQKQLWLNTNAHELKTPQDRI